MPLLTADALRRGAIPPNSLVRVVGMVQDAFNPEYYPCAVPVAPSGAATGGPRAVTYGAFRDTLSANAALEHGADLSHALMSRCVLACARRRLWLPRE